MNAENYCQILEETLKPFVESVFPNNNYRFQQDNDMVSRVFMVSTYIKQYI